MSVTEWKDESGTEYVDIELHLRDRTALGYPAALSVPFLDTFNEILPDPPFRELQAVELTAQSFGESAAALYGQLLFEWLFVGRLREGFLMSRQLVADSPCTRWRFRVRFADRGKVGESHPLTALHWEALRYQKDSWSLGLETAFARSRAASGLTPLLVNERPIQLFAAATSGTIPQVVSDELLRDILPVFDHNVTRPLGKLVDAKFAHPPASLEQVLKAYHKSQPHCLVLCGAFDVAGGESAMWFDDGPQSATRVPWKTVVAGLTRVKPPQLVVLMGPLHGAETAHGLAGELHDAMRVRSVVQVTGKLDRRGFETFGEAFLQRLLGTGAVDEAVAIGRRALNLADPNGWGWTIPVLSLQTSGDGLLFYLLPESIESDLSQLRNVAR